MENEVKRADQIDLGDILITLATPEEREFAMIPPSLLGIELEAEEQLSLKVAYFYEHRINDMNYYQLLKQDCERNHSPLLFDFARAMRLGNIFTLGKPIIIVIALFLLFGLFILIFPAWLAVCLFLAVIWLVLRLVSIIDCKMLKEHGIKSHRPSLNEVDEIIASIEQVLIAARRELKSLEKRGGLREEAWPFAEEIWDEFITHKAYSVDQALTNLGFEFEDEE